MIRSAALGVVAATSALIITASAAFAAVPPTASAAGAPASAVAPTTGAPPPIYVQFSPSATKGALYYPDPAIYAHPNVAVIVMHRDSNYLSHISTVELPKRGFVVLGMNPRCDNNEAACAPWENNALDVKQGVQYLRALPGITKVILLGHSGGGPTMAFYQAVAEQGVSFCQQPDKLMKCDDKLADLPPVDGVMLMDAHPGNGINAVRSISADVTNDAEMLNNGAEPQIDPSLDPFSEANGYNPNGPTHYSDDFKTRYFKAQSDRMNTLIALAQDRLAAAEAKGQDDAPFVVPMADDARLSQIDLSIDASTDKPEKLIKNDGTIVDDQIVHSVRVPSLKPGDEKSFESTMMLTAKSFLSVRAVKSTNSMTGIDFCSSNNSTPCDLAQVHVPLLVTAMGGHYFIHDAEQYYEQAASPDKDFYVIEGATHGGTECTACETTPGQYSNATKNLFDLMQRWLDARYAQGSTTLSAHAAAVSFGRVATITVRVGGSSRPAGSVSLMSSAGATVATAPVTNGVATLRVPTAPLGAGNHQFTVNYSGSGANGSATGTVVVKVAKAASKVTARALPETVTPGTRGKALIRVTAGAATPTGTVKVSRNGRVVARGTLNADGKVTVTLPRLFGAGMVGMRVLYPGTANIKRASATLRITVRRTS